MTVKTNKVQVGQNADALKNFTIMVPDAPDGSMEIRRGNADAPGALITKINPDGGVNTGGAAFSAYASASTSMPSLTFVKLMFQTEEYDTAGCYDAANGRFTPNAAGYYRFTCRYELATSAAQTITHIYKNGLLVKAGPNLENTFCGYVDANVYLNGTGDYVEIYARQSAATQNMYASNAPIHCYFQGHLARSV